MNATHTHNFHTPFASPAKKRSIIANGRLPTKPNRNEKRPFPAIVIKRTSRLPFKSANQPQKKLGK